VLLRATVNDFRVVGRAVLAAIKHFAKKKKNKIKSRSSFRANAFRSRRHYTNQQTQRTRGIQQSTEIRTSVKCRQRERRSGRESGESTANKHTLAHCKQKTVGVLKKRKKKKGVCRAMSEKTTTKKSFL
jgi:hypothetical protein